MAKSSAPRDINAAQRAVWAIQLRSKRMTYDEIALVCGYADRASCYNAVQRELERVVVSNVDELRREEAESLDRLEAECWKRLEDAEYGKSMLFAVDRIVQIKERRARMFGLDIPVGNNAAANLVVIREVPHGLIPSLSASSLSSSPSSLSSASASDQEAGHE